TIGHGAIVHGAILKDRCLIGMGAIILDNAVVGHDCLVGAGALVPEGMVIPDGHLAIGVPAKVKRPLTPEEIRSLKESAEHYVQYAKQTVAG
ncbi:MAG TPA: gamma carbonic anhydrase family protein, partial [Myxococcota bacterium]|nr:gamma carbonic anhydrase family protein [Myxococcota bacterium]